MASAALRDTRRRIRSIESTKKITRAMELIAASRIPKAMARVNASKPYSAKLIEVIENVGGSGSGTASHMLLEERPVETVGVVVVASDRGLAGAYATNIIRLAEQAMIDHRAAGRDVALFTVGKKAQSYFRYRGYRISRAWLGVTDTPGYGDARSIANTIMEAYASGDVDKVESYFTTFQSALSQVPTAYELLPIVPPSGTEREGPAVTYEYEPSPSEILDRLLPRYVEATIFSMLLESSASEHSARRRAMKAATDNAEELIRVLTVRANRARQAEITTAITEIVGGAEALAE
ncbi:MAG TPA: F0F1 ATP synthase subunit gamma [Acidimicrobiia bacterium]|nr:F0F1 ATP synthase subunit gamma [Acidimicrobiia bacterium]